MELQHYLSVFRRWSWILILCVLEATSVAYYFASKEPNVYEARARYLVGCPLDQPNCTVNDRRIAAEVGQTYAELATSRPVLQSAIDKLQLNFTPSGLAGRVNATFLETTLILSIRARSSDPQRAADIANAIGEALIERSPGGSLTQQAERRQEALAEIEQIQERISTLQAEINSFTDQIQQTTDQLQQRALMLRLDQVEGQLNTAQRDLADRQAIVDNTSPNQIAILEPAIANPNPVAPRVMTNVLAALLGGLVLGLAMMVLFEYLLDAVYTPEELHKATNLPYLGGIIRHRKLRGSGSKLIVQAKPMSATAESYRVLRANLQRATANQQLSSLLITSPSPGDGKTAISANLAVAFANAGKRVILIDADLRRPQIATLFGLVEDQNNGRLPGSEAGLSSLLTSPAPILEPIPVPSAPGLSVLPAGSPALNSSEILASQRMRQLLQAYQSWADLIIVDSPPLPFSDALTLASQVDGVLLVANTGKTRRQHTIKAVASLRLAGAHLVGTVFNRVRAKMTYAYYSSDMVKLQDQGLDSRSSAPHERGQATRAAAVPPARAGGEPVWDGALVEEDGQLIRRTQVLPEVNERSLPRPPSGLPRPDAK